MELENGQNLFGWSTNHSLILMNKDRSFNQNGMLDHRLNEPLIGQILIIEVELFIGKLLGSEERSWSDTQHF